MTRPHSEPYLDPTPEALQALGRPGAATLAQPPPSPSSRPHPRPRPRPRPRACPGTTSSASANRTRTSTSMRPQSPPSPSSTRSSASTRRPSPPRAAPPRPSPSRHAPSGRPARSRSSHGARSASPRSLAPPPAPHSRHACSSPNSLATSDLAAARSDLGRWSQRSNWIAPVRSLLLNWMASAMSATRGELLAGCCTTVCRLHWRTARQSRALPHTRFCPSAHGSIGVELRIVWICAALPLWARKRKRGIPHGL